MLVYEDHAAQILLAGGPGRPLVVTFNALDFIPNGRRFWGDEPLRKLGLSALGIVAKRSRWFADGFMRRALNAAMTHLAPYPDRLAYGFSMGAYGAIRHARKLGCQVVVALSPQWTIEPAKLAGVEQPYRDFYRPDKHDGMALTDFPDNARLYLVFDPHNRHDAWHAARICEHIPAAVPVHMPFVGHETIWPLSGTAILGDLLGAAWARDDDRVRAVARQARRSFPGRGVRMAAHLRRRKTVLARAKGIKLLLETGHLAAADQAARVWLAYAEAARRPAEVRASAQEAIALNPGRHLVAEAERLIANACASERPR